MLKLVGGKREEKNSKKGKSEWEVGIWKRDRNPRLDFQNVISNSDYEFSPFGF